VGWANHHHYSLRSNNNAIIMYSFRSLTIQHLSVFLFTLLLLASCSSDPCEEVTCLNGGTCDDGSCDCPDGWTGTDCSVYDFDYVGDYTAKALTFADCNDASEEGSLQADANDRFCFNAANNSRNCSRLVLELNQGLLILQELQALIQPMLKPSHSLIQVVIELSSLLTKIDLDSLG